MTRMFQGRDIQAAFSVEGPFLSCGGHAPPPPLVIEDRLDFDQGLLMLNVRNAGPDEAVFHLYDGLLKTPSPQRHRLKAGKSLSLAWPADLYDLHLIAPDGLYRRFAGRLKADGSTSASLVPARRGLGLILGLTSLQTGWFCLVDESGRRTTRRSRILAGERRHLRIPVHADGWYDVSVSRVGGVFRRRFAGRWFA